MIFSLESYAEDEILIRGTSENRKEASGTAEIDGSVVGKKNKTQKQRFGRDDYEEEEDEMVWVIRV